VGGVICHADGPERKADAATINVAESTDLMTNQANAGEAWRDH
jgi:hypothetical protein